ncbi:MAG: hypothetical protein H7067_11105 [Burkholderiales bacterium]|nr:hypothetical protein [Opitutaceae bacterium]
MRAPRIPASALLAITGALVLAPGLLAAEIVLTDPDYDAINANGLDQPRLYFLLSDPAQGDAVITWENPASGATEPVLLTAFIDTGASGFALSHLHISGDYEQPVIGLSPDQPGDFLGPFTEIGIGGPEVGDVSRPLGVWVRNGAVGASEEILVSDFINFGDFSLWTRRETGAAEVVDFLGFPIVSPLNLVGMPVIRQRRLLLDVTPMSTLTALGLPDPLETALLASGAPEPLTQATIPLVLRDFIGNAPPAGEVLPSHYANPLVPGLTLHGTGGASASGEWLLDTGAGASFASFATARAAGLVPAHYATLAEFMADYTGPTVEIGGIGASQTVPRLTAPRITVATREGATLAWKNVELLIADVAGLDGIFGMNLLVPSITLDPADPLGSLAEISPSTIRTVVIDTTDAADPVMRLGTSAADGTVFAWLGENFSAAERSLPNVGALAADPDTDGFSNLLEYALGLDPRVADSASAAPQASAPLIGDARYLALSFSRPAVGRPDVNYAVEISNDLATWRRDTGEVVAHSAQTIGERETLTLRTAAPLAPGGRVFLRLHVSLTN